MSKRNELPSKILKLLLDEGIQDQFLNAKTAQESQEVMRNVVEALGYVSSKMAVSFLLRLLQDQQNPMVVADAADQLVMLQAHHFDQCLNFELASAMDMLQEIIDPNPSGTTH